MSIKQMPGRVLISLLLSVTGLLSGCASHNENASLLAKKQAQNISQNLPIKSAGYTLVLAQSSGTTVKMTIISEAGTQTTQTPDAFSFESHNPVAVLFKNQGAILQRLIS